ncbi:MAG: hypothetical protein ABJH82_01475 [Polaribacter sp.]|uniref:hypothetical protein n=1 Tax=Polaribacter sp. TaxID=1920175 RepID=UPI0032664E2E
MISITIFIVFISFYLFYKTSKKTVKHSPKKLDKWIVKNNPFTKIIASILLLISIIANIYLFGFTSGFLLFFILLMTVGSLIIMIAPLKLIQYKSVLILFITSLLFELFIF